MKPKHTEAVLETTATRFGRVVVQLIFGAGGSFDRLDMTWRQRWPKFYLASDTKYFVRRQRRQMLKVSFYYRHETAITVEAFVRTLAYLIPESTFWDELLTKSMTYHREFVERQARLYHANNR